ncbi:hypothetical protein [Vogesella indigofera]|uniref:Uncharacterized protein n=1 Tax=Vogesella indigofera TaxID=45465 RepID=A0ABT5I2I4_VOGIN|nr:hypothetical protein [Vogesella indigofera]MDC7690378.1 hypothetical protein [Vogesella indigofera]
MSWLDKFSDKLADAVYWVTDKTEKGYDSVKDGVSYVTGSTARSNFGRAKRIVENAKDEFQAAVEKLEETKGRSFSEFESLGALRLKVQSDQMRKFVDLVNHVNCLEYKDLNLEVFGADMSLPSVQKIEVSSYQATDMLKDGIQAISAGTLAGVGAVGLATSFGVASTGTAISTLSGAAATNATLAWLGGGSLAAGGLGVAGGTAVLGGIVAVPLLIAFAASATSKSEKALTEARAQEAEYEVATKNAELMTTKVECVIRRTQEVYHSTLALTQRFDSLLSSTGSIIAEKENIKLKLHNEAEEAKTKYSRKFFLLRWFDKLFGRTPSFAFPDPLDINNFNQSEKDNFMMTVNFGFALYSVLKIKVLDENGEVSSESMEAIDAERVLLGGEY